MSDTASCDSKSLSESADSESTINPLMKERWTNNISYRQLVMSSCVGICQLWWHPYLHDLRKLLPFLFLYNVFSLLLAYPLFYLELALGVVTKKGVLRCWDLAPIARGVGFAMLGSCLFTTLALGSVGAWCLALFVHSFHSFLPWLHCAASARPACAARHRPLPSDSETPAHSFFFNFVLNLKREGLEGGLGNIVWELAWYYIICWVLIYFVAVKRIYSYSKLVMYKDLTAFFLLLCCGAGAVRLDGAGRMFHDCDWSVLFNGFDIWLEAIEYALLQMSISHGTLIMLGSYCPKERHRLGTTAMLAFGASKISCMISAFVLGATHGALMKDYENSSHLWSGSGSAMILWSEFVARVPGSQFWSALLFFTLFVLSVSSAALLVQTMMSTFTGRSIRKIAWAFHIVVCLLFCFIGTITLCTQGGQYILNFLMYWPVSKPRVPIAAAIAVVVTYVYGQTAFCEDVFFAVGEYPAVFMRVCWALWPPILLTVFVTELGLWPYTGTIAGWLIVLFTVSPIALVILFYSVFKCRVRNIVRDGK
ncbi:sodium- and chloride-dependent transporter XTRP3B-like [Bombyx mandarina]|uniref:Sodium- and chloride-dependent transporter XTRP3B-like n=1 Tax=Bombyx mandarina TaxID=7092 RepID=A0A6J2JHK3_BOMMA|nr:sodium- and chloride-dependent transporter XTRP3B-like [Bombyx mandarina]